MLGYPIYPEKYRWISLETLDIPAGISRICGIFRRWGDIHRDREPNFVDLLNQRLTKSFPTTVNCDPPSRAPAMRPKRLAPFRGSRVTMCDVGRMSGCRGPPHSLIRWRLGFSSASSSSACAPFAIRSIFLPIRTEKRFSAACRSSLSAIALSWKLSALFFL